MSSSSARRLSAVISSRRSRKVGGNSARHGAAASAGSSSGQRFWMRSMPMSTRGSRRARQVSTVRNATSSAGSATPAASRPNNPRQRFTSFARADPVAQLQVLVGDDEHREHERHAKSAEHQVEHGGEIATRNRSTRPNSRRQSWPRRHRQQMNAMSMRPVVRMTPTRRHERGSTGAPPARSPRTDRGRHTRTPAAPPRTAPPATATARRRR